jgi:plastocyanin
MTRRLWIVAIAAVGACSQPKPKEQAKAPSPEPQFFTVDPAAAGVISGKIIYTGKRPAAKRINIDEDEKCVALNRAGLFDEALVVNKNGTLPNVFVYVKQGLEGKAFERSQAAIVLDQKGCRFVPRVLGIQAGQTLKVTNSDPVTHNVHPVAKMNREWNQSQSPGDPPLERRFARPEVMVRVKCNVHSWMRSWLGVLNHPYFAVTGTDGSFEIANLPPGDYTVEAWQESLGVQEQRVHVDPRGKTTAIFKFDGGQL